MRALQQHGISIGMAASVAENGMAWQLGSVAAAAAHNGIRWRRGISGSSAASVSWRKHGARNRNISMAKIAAGRQYQLS